MQAFKHARSGALFVPRMGHKRNPSDAISPERDYSVKQAAATLGGDANTMQDLIDAGHVHTNRDGSIDGRALKSFASQLKPVAVEYAETDAKTAKGASAKAPPAKPASKRAASPSARKPAKPSPVDDVDDSDDLDEPSVLSATCPNCGSDLLIAGGVEKARCPGCKQSLVIAHAHPLDDEDQDEDQDDYAGDEDDDQDENPGGILGIFRHGRSR